MRRTTILLLATCLIACEAPAATLGTPTARASSAPAVPPLPAAPAATPAAPPAITTVDVAKVPAPRPLVELGAVRFTDATHGWLGTADGLMATSDGGATWTRQLTSGRIERIWSYDTTHAWAIAGDTLYRTTDGRAWSAVPPTTPPIRELFFISPTLGWATATAEPPAGEAPIDVASTLLRTTDGGVIWRTWSAQPIQSVCFTDELNGWGANDQRVFRTTDGGRTWRQMFDAKLDPRIPHWGAQIVCADMTSAWVQLLCACAGMSHSGYLVYSTHDAGASWRLEYGEGYTLGSLVPPFSAGLGSYPSVIASRSGGGASFITCTPPASSQRVVLREPAGERAFAFAGTCPHNGQVVDDRTVVLVTSDGYQATAVQTTDGGASWRTIFPASGPPLSRFVRAGDALVGLARGGDAGGVYASTDNGGTWARIGEIPTPTAYYPSYDISGPSFVDATHGWIAGMDGQLYATADGGHTWVRAASPDPTAGAGRVDFVDAVHGWVVAGALFHTSDAGATWAQVIDVAAHTDLACVASGCWVYVKDGALVFVREDGSTTLVDVPELRSEAATLRLHADALGPTVIATWWPFDACHDFGLRSCARVITRTGANRWSEVRIPIATEWPGDLWWTDAATVWFRTAGHLYRSDDAGRTWSDA
jgi:photosystem II stability/assembly factor-like uncharacterized protein